MSDHVDLTSVELPERNSAGLGDVHESTPGVAPAQSKGFSHLNVPSISFSLESVQNEEPSHAPPSVGRHLSNSISVIKGGARTVVSYPVRESLRSLLKSSLLDRGAAARQNAIETLSFSRLACETAASEVANKVSEVVVAPTAFSSALLDEVAHHVQSIITLAEQHGVDKWVVSAVTLFSALFLATSKKAMIAILLSHFRSEVSDCIGWVNAWIKRCHVETQGMFDRISAVAKGVASSADILTSDEFKFMGSVCCFVLGFVPGARDRKSVV